jgi:hypothetical protein
MVEVALAVVSAAAGAALAATVEVDVPDPKSEETGKMNAAATSARPTATAIPVWVGCIGMVFW